jgi:hypothetical protein
MVLGKRHRKCLLHRRTNWLLRPSIAGLASVKRKYPISQFQAFWSATKRYAELTKADDLIHKRVATAVHGLVDYLSAERKRVPIDVVRDAERLECLLFMGYDPYFEGDEPPGL